MSCYSLCLLQPSRILKKLITIIFASVIVALMEVQILEEFVSRSGSAPYSLPLGVKLVGKVCAFPTDGSSLSVSVFCKMSK